MVSMVIGIALRRAICGVLAAALSFAQVAAAGHACGGAVMPDGPAGAMAAMQHAVSTPGIAGTRPDAPNMDHGAGDRERLAAVLCAEHCEHRAPAALDLPVAGLPPALLVPLYVLPPRPELRDAAALRAARSPEPGVVFPPHAILHCCFLI